MKSSLAAQSGPQACWCSPAPLPFLFYSIISPPFLFVFVLVLLIVCLLGLPILVLSLASWKHSYVSHLRCSSLSVPLTVHSSSQLCALLIFVFYFVLILQQSVLPCLICTVLLCVSFTSQLSVYSGVFFLSTFYAFIFFLPWYSFSCLTVRVQFECLIRYLFTGFPEKVLWLLCRAWLLLDPAGRFIPGLGLYHSILGRSS